MLDGKDAFLKISRLLVEFAGLVKLVRQQEALFKPYLKILGQVSQKLLAACDQTLIGREIKMNDLLSKEEIDAFVESLFAFNSEIQDLEGAQPWTAQDFFN